MDVKIVNSYIHNWSKVTSNEFMYIAYDYIGFIGILKISNASKAWLLCIVCNMIVYDYNKWITCFGIP